MNDFIRNLNIIKFILKSESKNVVEEGQSSELFTLFGDTGESFSWRSWYWIWILRDKLDLNSEPKE